MSFIFLLQISCDKIKKEVQSDSNVPKKKRLSAYERRMNQRNLRMTEMRKRQSENKNSCRLQNQLIRPPAFMPPPPPSDFNINSIPPPFSLSGQTSFDFRLPPPPVNISSGYKPPDYFPSFNSGVSFPSSRLSHGAFNNQPNLIIPKDTPLQWSANNSASSSSTFNSVNNSLPPPLFNPSNIFSPPPSPHGTTHFINHMNSLLPSPRPVGNAFSSPIPNNSNSATFPPFHGNSRVPHAPDIVSPFGSFTSYNEIPFSTPPPPPALRRSHITGPRPPPSNACNVNRRVNVGVKTEFRFP